MTIISEISKQKVEAFKIRIYNWVISWPEKFADAKCDRVDAYEMIILAQSWASVREFQSIRGLLNTYISDCRGTHIVVRIGC